MQVSGQVSQIKARTTKFGDMYDVVVNGKSYGHGKYAPRGIQQGDFVSFEVDIKQNGQYTNYNIRSGTLRKDDGAATQDSPKPAAAPARQTFVPNDARQETISKQAALNTAIAFCNFAAANGAVPMPKSVKESDKLGLLQQWFYETAATFYNLSTGNTWDMPEVNVALIQKPTKAKPAAKPAEEEAEDTGYNEYE